MSVKCHQFHLKQLFITLMCAKISEKQNEAVQLGPNSVLCGLHFMHLPTGHRYGPKAYAPVMAANMAVKAVFAL